LDYEINLAVRIWRRREKETVEEGEDPDPIKWDLDLSFFNCLLL
jgi:hypothetical protein